MSVRNTGASAEEGCNDLDVALGFLETVLGATYEIAVFRKAIDTDTVLF
jgi:hypothetical protein